MDARVTKPFWTPEEDDFILEMRDRGYNSYKIAELVRRKFKSTTHQSIRRRLKRLEGGVRQRVISVQGFKVIEDEPEAGKHFRCKCLDEYLFEKAMEKAIAENGGRSWGPLKAVSR